MKIKFAFLSIIVHMFWLTSFAQNIGNVFKDGDRVCFVGNSITNSGYFFNYVYQYYTTRFPNENIQFINCGISGDRASGVLKRMNSDILVHKPTWCVVKLGMNDVERSYYTETMSKTPDINKRREEVFLKYKKNLEEIVTTLLKNNINVIMQTPTIYDETAQLPTLATFGVNAALKEYAEYVKALATKYKLITVDYFSILNSLNKKVQEMDKIATLIGNDRVHPGIDGHMIMAYRFLEDTKAPKFVSEIFIESTIEKSNQRSLNCNFSKLSFSNDDILFSVIENSLPMPFDENVNKALSLVPFSKTFNQEIIKVDNIKEGIYSLFIDNQEIGSYSNENLRNGIDISSKKNTPQYKQALLVQKLCVSYRATESSLRSIGFVEYNHLAEFDLSKTDTTALRTYLEKKLERYKSLDSYSYYKSQFNSYFTNKQRQPITEANLGKIRAEIYRINKPVIHNYKLIRKD